MAINQFIAHHAVIFQPEKRLMWVSTSPWQVGEMVAYDLGDVFKKGSQGGIDQNRSKVTSIPADSLLLNNVCPKVVEFRKLAGIINEAVKERKSIDSNVLQRFVEINPDYDYTYSLIDKYNSSSKKD
ncbi:MAG TPA: choloylglycine hydrolase, partial [Bacteroidales bacterium]|nr:choloylglycine hydrolase [Bacteroidales bacterium]